MRWTALLFLLVTSLGCTSQSSGYRCQQNSDCNTDTDTCRNELSPQTECTQTSCICCPTDLMAASAVIVNNLSVCVPRNLHPDAGPTDTGPADVGFPEASTDTGPVDVGVREAGPADVGFPEASVADAGVVCTANGQCDPGSYCAGDGCGTSGHCVARPIASNCAPVENPVCGCDNLTYGNVCEASSHGVRVTAAGACDAGARVDAGSTVDVGTDAGSAVDVGVDAGAPMDAATAD